MSTPGHPSGPGYPSRPDGGWDDVWTGGGREDTTAEFDQTSRPPEQNPVYDSVYHSPGYHPAAPMAGEPWLEPTEPAVGRIRNPIFSTLMVLTGVCFVLVACGLLAAVGIRMSGPDRTAGFGFGEMTSPVGLMIALPVIYLLLAATVELLRRAVLSGSTLARITCSLGAFVAVVLGVLQLVGPDAVAVADSYGAGARIGYSVIGVVQIIMAVVIGITAWRRG